MRLPVSRNADRISAREKAFILKAVAAKHGELTPDLVVAESDPSNRDGVALRLAGLVGWNDTDAEAASKWRVECARSVIRSAEPQLIKLGIVTLKAPYYVHDPLKGPGEQGYVPLLRVKSEREAAEDLLRSEINSAVASMERAYNIAAGLGMMLEAAELFNALASLGRSPSQLPETAEVSAVFRAREEWRKGGVRQGGPGGRGSDRSVR